MEKKKSTIILIMRESPERDRLRQVLNQFADVVTVYKKDDVLQYLKQTISNNDDISNIIGDFSDLEIDAWGILEPLLIVMKGIPVYVIADKDDIAYQEMMTGGVAGVFTRPFSIETVCATIETDLMMRTDDANSIDSEKRGDIK